MSKPRSAAFTVLIVSLIISSSSRGIAGTSFQQAVAHYNQGHYSQALAEFRQFEASYPTNAMSHYYIALCCQSMGNRAEARQEYILTSQYGDASLKSYAQKALSVLGGNSAAAGSLVTAADVPVKTGSAQSGSPNASVSEVLEFYTDWCHVCKSFEPVWSQTQGRVSGVQFHQYNAEDAANLTLVQKYAVKAYPTLVYLDKSGKVLKNQAGCPNTVEDFAQQIKLLH